MADNPRDSNDLEKRRPDEAALSARLRRLGDRLGQQRPGEPSETGRGPPAADASGYARGFRLSSELVGGVLVGAGIGWALDRVLGTSPWGLIVFLLLGFAGGVFSVVRAAGVAPPPASPPPRAGQGRQRGVPPESKRDDTT
jgi:ATP synthase protein I